MVGNPESVDRSLRHQIAHDLASPVRGIAILADLLAESLGSEPFDFDALHDVSSQLTSLSAEATQRLQEFATADDS